MNADEALDHEYFKAGVEIESLMTYNLIYHILVWIKLMMNIMKFY